MSWYLKVLKQYIRFNGRAIRQEYWYFQIIHWLIIVSFGIVFSLMTDFLGIPESIAEKLIMPFFSIYFFGTILPSLAVTIRRLHDTNRSGWWILLNLLNFIPFLGSLILFVFLVQDSQPGRNRFGRNPKEIFQ